MKIGGLKIENMVNVIDVFIPRGENGGFEFKCQAVSLEDFTKMYPEPVPRMKHKPGAAAPEPALNDPKYVEALADYGTNRMHYICLQSLKATPDLEWETVDPADVDTWGNYQDELEAGGFSDVEIGRIIQGVMRANNFDEAFISERYANFLALKAQQEQEEPQSPQEEGQDTMESGEPVSE